MRELHVVLALAPPHRAGPPAEGVSARRRAARTALSAGARLAGAPFPWTNAAFDPPRDPHGAPQPVSGWSWTVSHTRQWVGAALWTGPVGLDIEGRRQPSSAVVEAASTTAERTLMEKHWDREEAFLRLWSAKEAVLKRTALGLAGLSATGLRALEPDGDLTRLTFDYEGLPFTVIQGSLDGGAGTVEHWWSLTAAGDPAPVLHLPHAMVSP